MNKHNNPLLILRNLTDEEIATVLERYPTKDFYKKQVILAEAHEIEIINPNQIDSTIYNDYRWMLGKPE